MGTMKKISYRNGWRPAVLGAAGILLFAPTPLFANSYWVGFKKHWFGYVANTSGVVVTALLVGAVALFIITRGKWGKS
jgi:hypothetical protein